jgi:PAS domain S-box-containing protein
MRMRMTAQWTEFVRRRLRGLTIRGRLMLLAAAVFLPCAALLAADAVLERRDALERALDAHQAEAQRIAERLAAVVERVRGMLIAVEALLGEHLDAGAANDEALRRLLAGAPQQVAWVNLADAEGRILASSSFGPEIRERVRIADREHFRRARDTRAFVVSEPIDARMTGEPVVVMAHPLSRADGAFAGVAAAVVEIARLQELVATHTGNAVAVGTERGQVLVAPGRRDLVGREASALAQFAVAHGGNVFRGETTDFDGRALLGASVPVRNAPWQVFYGAPREEVLRAVQQRSLAAALLAAGALFAGLLLAGGVGRGIVRDILQLRRGVHALARGAFGHRITLGQAGELGQLATDVNRMAEALGAAEARLRSLVALSSDFFWETDSALRVTRLEGNVAELSAGEVGGRHLAELGYGLSGDLARYRQVLERREPFRDVEFVRIGAEGTIVQVLRLSGEPVYGADGGFLGYRGVGRDVTAQFETREALRAEGERLARVIETMTEGLVILDADGRFVLLNASAERILGTQRSDILGRSFLEVPWRRVPLDGHSEALPQAVFGRLRSGELRAFGPAAYAIERADGVRRILSHRAARLEDPAGAFAGVVVTFEDITERLAAEEEHRREILALNADLERRVEERTAELAQAYREMEAFSYSVSHDLRAPLRAISGFARIVLEDFRGEVPEEAARLLVRIAQNAERMGALIDGLLDFSRLSRQPLRLARVRPADLVREVLEELAPLRESRRIEIRVGEMPECEADRLLLRQVYANLLANAIKYTSGCAEARIEVGAITMGLGPVYYVRDNGVGFDMAHAGKLFGMFQRLHLPSEAEGNGIGLALVRRIVERHGGRVWADAAPGNGATFFFRLGADSPAARRGVAQAAA